MEKDDDEREAYNNVAGSSMLYNPFAGVVKSLWGTTTEDKTDSKSDRAGGPETEPPPSAHLGEKESSFDEQSEVILVDLESLPTAVVFGPKGRGRRLGSREELRQLKDELAMRSTSSDTISTSARERDTDSDVEDDGHQLVAQTQEGSWAIFQTAKSWSLSVQSAFASVGSTIKYSIISPQTEETFGKIADLASRFFADVNVSYAELIVGLMMLSICQRKLRETIRTEIPVTRLALEDGYYYMRFAAAVYGWQLIYGYNFEGKANGLFKGLVSGDSINPQIVAAKTGIDESDLITTQWDSKDFNPGHYMAYDHARKTVVIAIRGTFHVKDALTDLVATYEPFEDGVAHCGILHTAQKKLELLEPFLLEALALHPDYGLVIVGHSLGAGAASLLTILLHTKYPELHIRCHAYATPCVVSLDLAKKYRHLITSYVMGDDLVPRLSYGSMEELKSNILIVLSQEKSNMARIFQLFAAGNALGNTATKKLEKLLRCNATLNIEELQRKRRTLQLPEKLWPPGVVYHMYVQPKKLWSDEDRERQRKQEQEDVQKSHLTPEQAIMEMIQQNEERLKAQEHHNRRRQLSSDSVGGHGRGSGEDERHLLEEFEAEREEREEEGGRKEEGKRKQRRRDREQGEKGEEEEEEEKEEDEHAKWSNVKGKGKEKKDEVPPSKNVRRKGQRRYAIEESAPSLFSEIIVSSNMLSDHFPDVYENVLKALVEELEEAEEAEEDNGGGEGEDLYASIGVERGEGSSEEVQLKKADLEREYAEGRAILRKEESSPSEEENEETMDNTLEGSEQRDEGASGDDESLQPSSNATNPAEEPLS